MLVLIRVLVKLMLHNLLPHQIMKKSCEIYCVANVHYTQTHTHIHTYIYIYIWSQEMNHFSIKTNIFLRKPNPHSLWQVSKF